MYNYKLNYLSDYLFNGCSPMPLLYYSTFSFYGFNMHLSRLKSTTYTLKRLFTGVESQIPAELIYKSRDNCAGF